MKVVYTDEALRDLDEILTFIALNYQSILPAFRNATPHCRAPPIRMAKERGRGDTAPGVRVVPLLRYPYKIFYRITSETVEILHIHHAARRDPDLG